MVTDAYGHFNTMSLTIATSLVIMAGVWFSIGHKLAVLYIFAVLFGVFTGGYISLVPSCIGQICTADRFGEVFGTCYSVVSFA